MPIRIWNEPGGPVRYGHDWTDLEDVLNEEMMKRLRLERTPRGRLVGPEDAGETDAGAVLDMTKPGNKEAFDRIMSRRSPFEGVGRERIAEAQSMIASGISPDEFTARRLSRPRFETSTLEIGDRDLGPVPQYTSTEMIEPSESDLERSAELWKMSAHPLEQEYASAKTEGALAEAAKDRALAEGYSKPEVPTGPSSEIMRGLLDNMVKMLENDPEFQALPYDQKMAYLMKKYEELFGAKQAPREFGGIGRMRGGSGASGAESALDEAMS